MATRSYCCALSILSEIVVSSWRLSISLADAFATAAYQRIMQRFIRSYVRELQRNPRQGTLAAEQRI
jgi:hypothetical protein